MSFVFNKPLPNYAKRGGFWSRRRLLAAALTIVIVVLYSSILSPPEKFPPNLMLTLKQGTTISKIASELESKEIIRSPFWFKMLVRFSGGKVSAGDYAFDKPQNVFIIAERFRSGRHELKPVKITIPEGSNNQEIAKIIAKTLPSFNQPRFLKLAKTREGYLFPDTYFFLPNVEIESILATLQENFHKKTSSISDEIKRSRRSPEDVLTMASLLEEEARTTETRRIVAGILWKRLDKGMLLQVDAVFPYIFNGRPFDLTDGDLQVDSPYNTYKYRGLPPGPITNPGLDSILSAVTPIKTPYYFYLSDKNGEMHYATTHDGHLVNREKYLQ